MEMLSKKIRRIRTGGQSGVDRAAMDFARERGIPLCGWCPKNGWAEDVPGIIFHMKVPQNTADCIMETIPSFTL